MAVEIVSSALLPNPTGLGVVGYTVFDEDGIVLVAHTTAGIVLLDSTPESGIFQAKISMPDGSKGTIVWDDPVMDIIVRENFDASVASGVSDNGDGAAILAGVVIDVTSDSQFTIDSSSGWGQIGGGTNLTGLLIAVNGAGGVCVGKITSNNEGLIYLESALAGGEPEIGDLVRVYPNDISDGDGGEVSGASGGGILSARISYSSLAPDDFLEIIQGEEKTITFIVEADGRFDNAVADAISVKLKDPTGIVVTKLDATIDRVTEELDVQVFRVTLSPDDTNDLSGGLLRIEIAFDLQKAVLTHAMKVVEAL